MVLRWRSLSMLPLCTLIALATQPGSSQGEGLLEMGQKARQFVDMESDQLEHDRQAKTITAVGGVHLQQGDEYRLHSDRAVYHTDSRRIDAVGKVELDYQSSKLRLSTEKATFDTLANSLEVPGSVTMKSGADAISGVNMLLWPRENRGTLEKMVMDMEGPGGHVTADKATLHDEHSMTLNQATFTNCDCDDAPWRLEADSLFLDKNENQLVAQNVALYFKGVPIAYSPWWQNPLFKKRKSGFLLPAIGHSGATGMELDLPYYFNIAPDKDATLTFHPTTERGFLLKGQFRYLAEGYRGIVENQSIFDTKDDAYRGLTLLDHRHKLEDWRLDINVQRIQTRDYLKDFHQDALDDKTRYTTNNLLVNRLWSRKGGLTELRGGTTWFQNLEALNDDFTIQRLPYLHLEDIRPLNGLGSGWSLESTAGMDQFYRLRGDFVQRLDISPSLSFRQPLYFGSLTAQLGVRETAYLTQGIALENPLDLNDTVSRQSSHGRLRLDGMLAKVYQGATGEARYRHTLEPTVQYVINAVNNQPNIPLLDTALRDMTATNLFSQYLYSGPDRLVSGQWLAYGLTTRLTGPRWGSDRVGEMVAFTIGQRWAPAEDREFQAQHAMSNVVTSMELFLSDQWSITSSALVDPYSGLFNRVDNTVNYASLRGDQVTFGHYLDRQRNTEDMVLMAKVRLVEPWSWIQEGDYSLERSTLNNWKSGLMYEHECWSIQLLGGKRLLQNTSQHGGGWAGFLINFKGLGDYGIRS
ncbi:MAG: LPS-assembly protein LptD [Magnetococcales bacterium]|nr:LPS-assembly protein LptD [Magnetococcales bacterium]